MIRRAFRCWPLGLFALLLLPACGGSNGHLPGGNVSFTARLDAIAPGQGPVLGGTKITLTGEGFREGAVGPPTPNEVTVLIGGVNAVDVTLIDDTTITCKTPDVCGPGAVDVTVFTTQSTLTLGDAFAYVGDPNPACAPPGGGPRILFTHITDLGGTDLWSMAPDGADPRRLTDTSSHGGEQWSPARDRLVHTRDGQVFVHDADGSNPIEITVGDDGIYDFAAWCPDETCLALVGFSAGHGPGLFVWDIATSVEVKLRDIGDSPTWAPDGLRLALVQNSLFVIDADGSNEQEIVPAVVNDALYADPDWGPDGIVFACRDIDTQRSTIWRVDPDGSNLQPLTFPVPEGDLDDHNPCWSPDGTQIAFLRRTAIGDDESQRVFVMGADGSNLHEVPGQARRAHTLDW